MHYWLKSKSSLGVGWSVFLTGFEVFFNRLKYILLRVTNAYSSRVCETNEFYGCAV